MSRSAFAEKHPWTLPWWKAEGQNFWTMIFIIAIHVLAVTGLMLFPLPGWRVFLAALLMACAGGLGTSRLSPRPGSSCRKTESGDRADADFFRLL
jgi:hypothetical protein